VSPKWNDSEGELSPRKHSGSKLKKQKPTNRTAQKKHKSLFKETISTKVKKQEKFTINLDEMGSGWNRNAPHMRSFR